MVLVAVIPVNGKIVICQSEVRSSEESVILIRHPVAELRLNGKGTELDSLLEVVPCRIVYRQCKRPVPCHVYFHSNIGNAHSQADSVGLEMQLVYPFLHLGSNGSCCCCRVGCSFCYSYNFSFSFRLFHRRELLLVGHEYHTGISHLLEEEAVHLLPYHTAIQCLQLYDTVVYVRMRIIIVHQSGLFLQYGNYLILVGKAGNLDL